MSGANAVRINILSAFAWINAIRIATRHTIKCANWNHSTSPSGLAVISVATLQKTHLKDVHRFTLPRSLSLYLALVHLSKMKHQIKKMNGMEKEKKVIRKINSEAINTISFQFTVTRIYMRDRVFCPFSTSSRSSGLSIRLKLLGAGDDLFHAHRSHCEWFSCGTSFASSERWWMRESPLILPVFFFFLNLWTSTELRAFEMNKNFVYLFIWCRLRVCACVSVCVLSH